MNYKIFLNNLTNLDKMLSINPKIRPTIWDILNKSFIKRRVVEYLTEIFSGNYPEASLPNDVDDIYIDSLKDQAEKLGILGNVREKVALSNNGGNKPVENDNQEKKSIKKILENKAEPKVIELVKQKKKQQYELRKILTEKEKLEVIS